MRTALIACNDKYGAGEPQILTPADLQRNPQLLACITSATTAGTPVPQPANQQAAQTLSSLRSQLIALTKGGHEQALGHLLDTNPYLTDFDHGGSKLLSLFASRPTAASLPTLPISGSASSNGTASPASVLVPPQSSSYYVLQSDTTCASTSCPLYVAGVNEAPDSLSVLQVGAPCGTNEFVLYAATNPCAPQVTAVGPVSVWADGFRNSPAHVNALGIVVIAANNSATNNSESNDPVTAYENGFNFYTQILFESYILYFENAVLSPYGAAVEPVAGDDMETGAGFQGPDTSLYWIDGFNAADTTHPDGPAAPGDPDTFPLIDDGDSTNMCSDAACFQTGVLDGTGYGDPSPWTPWDVWAANWGILNDAGSPQVYDADRATDYADLDSAAVAANPPEQKPAASPLPVWEAVMFGCPSPSGQLQGDEPSASQSYVDFSSATNQKPPFLTDFHALGDESPTMCGGFP